ncbi:MAG: hypothetical protein OIF58_05015, partial [Cohaesibacter sp.]|nr:hypothetical protein [Cohaesibacter sp.]
LRKDKEENRDNVVHFQDFTTQSLRKNASPFGFVLKHPSIETRASRREPPLFCSWFFYLNASRQTE